MASRTSWLFRSDGFGWILYLDVFARGAEWMIRTAYLTRPEKLISSWWKERIWR